MAEDTSSRTRVTVNIGEAELADLRRAADLRFGGTVSRAADWAAVLLLEVVGDPATFGATDARDALARYVAARVS